MAATDASDDDDPTIVSPSRQPGSHLMYMMIFWKQRPHIFWFSFADITLLRGGEMTSGRGEEKR